MGRTAYSSANRAYPFLQEESEPSQEEMQGQRGSNPGLRVFGPRESRRFRFRKELAGPPQIRLGVSRPRFP